MPPIEDFDAWCEAMLGLADSIKAMSPRNMGEENDNLPRDFLAWSFHTRRVAEKVQSTPTTTGRCEATHTLGWRCCLDAWHGGNHQFVVD